jgi:Raf kinase inhibitor-like YbhB/YbcL family protein
VRRRRGERFRTFEVPISSPTWRLQVVDRENRAAHTRSTKRRPLMLDVTSPAFGSNEAIPAADARSIAILVDDPDAPHGPFLHWLVTDLPTDLAALDEGGTVPHDANVAESDAGTASYYGPCPMHGTHRYRFHVYALDTTIGRPDTREGFLSAIEGHVLDEGELVGTYERQVRA